jgi:hypothetical protein
MDLPNHAMKTLMKLPPGGVLRLEGRNQISTGPNLWAFVPWS